jgi:hypothetical protein
VFDILVLSRREIVEDDHGVPVLEQQVSQMRADEAGSASDQRLHALSLVS